MQVDCVLSICFFCSFVESVSNFDSIHAFDTEKLMIISPAHRNKLRLLLSIDLLFSLCRMAWVCMRNHLICMCRCSRTFLYDTYFLCVFAFLTLLLLFLLFWSFLSIVNMFSFYSQPLDSLANSYFHLSFGWIASIFIYYKVNIYYFPCVTNDMLSHAHLETRWYFCMNIY